MLNKSDYTTIEEWTHGIRAWLLERQNEMMQFDATGDPMIVTLRDHINIQGRLLFELLSITEGIAHVKGSSL